MTERLHFHFSLSSTGEGNGNPLQCSCLENPRDGEAWWAAVYGVTQSQTRLTRLSSSCSSGRIQRSPRKNINKDGEEPEISGHLRTKGKGVRCCEDSVKIRHQFSPSFVSNSLQPYESQHARPPCPSPTPGAYSNSCPSSR